MEREILVNSTGCAANLLMLIATLIAGILGYFPTSNPTSRALVATDYSFTLVEAGVEYSYGETLNCQFVIAGDIEFLRKNASDHENLAITIQPLGTYDERPPTIIEIGSDTRFGENGWSQLLVGNYWYLVWVYDLTSNVPLSQKILVDGLDCTNDRTIARVNFQQTQFTPPQ